MAGRRKNKPIDIERLTVLVLLHVRAGRPLDLSAFGPEQRAYARDLHADVVRSIARHKLDRAADPSIPPLQFDIPA
jgi:hypothetical protein